VVGELEEVFGQLSGRPLWSWCRGQEIEEQAAMFGLARSKVELSFDEKVIPAWPPLCPVSPIDVESHRRDIPFQADRVTVTTGGSVPICGRPVTPGSRGSGS